VNTHVRTTISEYARTLISVKANQLVGKYGFTPADREDIEQDLVVAILEAAASWDAGRGSRNTYDNRIVQRKIATIIRHRKRQRRDYRRDGVSLNEIATDEDGASVTVGDTLTEDADRRRPTSSPKPERIDLAADLREALGRLEPELRRLCALLATGTKAAAAEAIGVSKPTVFKRRDAIRERFSELGLEEYLRRGADGSPCDGVCDQ